MIRRRQLETQEVTYEADNEQDDRIIRDYIETDDRNMQLLFIIDFARSLLIYSIMNNINELEYVKVYYKDESGQYELF